MYQIHVVSDTRIIFVYHKMILMFTNKKGVNWLLKNLSFFLLKMVF